MLRKIKEFFLSKNPGSREIKEAYVSNRMQDLRFWYREGKDHTKMQVLRYLGESDSQENLDFLAAEMQKPKDKALQTALLTTVTKMLQNDKRYLSNNHEAFYKQNKHLVDESTISSVHDSAVSLNAARKHTGKSTGEYLKDNLDKAKIAGRNPLNLKK